MRWIAPPPSPPESEWTFVDDLRSPMKRTFNWNPRPPTDDEISFANGTVTRFDFPDPKDVLPTAYDDWRRFLSDTGVPSGEFVFSTERRDLGEREAWRLDVDDDGCRIVAGDTEGVRRAIFFLEDETLRRGGPFLPRGVTERRPFVKTRISRCFFGPIKRPPRNRDELTDDIDYYPENYLNRLAHEGVNGLWLTVHFNDLCPSRFFPEHGKDRERRLEKLRRTVEKCGRYGIKIYAFCIEPIAFRDGVDDHSLSATALADNPWFAGHREGNVTYFCTSSLEGREYLRDCARFLFTEVPGLGGLIDINMGERPTHCYSGLGNLERNNCPRCSKRKPAEVFAELQATLAEEMRSVNPEAEMISWLYVPQLRDTAEFSMENTKRRVGEIAARAPESVIFQYNFESGGMVEQLGRERIASDYWLSWPGPSDVFANCAKNAVANGARASAKIQVGCSHEVATVPFMPVPGNLHKKYKAMRELGVSAVMQCWYFGNYPGLMNKAAGELAFEPFPENEDDFLLNLARIDWGRHAETVVEAWTFFQDAYANFPVNLRFTHYGPVHHAVVWPLHLLPVDQPIAPSWKFTFPLESGDRIGECLCFDHTLDEALFLLDAMATLWERGVERLRTIENDFSDNPERLLDIGLAKALSLQIRSARNVFKFYALREELPYKNTDDQRADLAAMKSLVLQEINNSSELKALCLRDSRLGFHSEAEGYKYHADKLEWRAKLLEDLLETDFPIIERAIENGDPLFPEHTGTKPTGASYHCPESEINAAWVAIDGDAATRWRAFADQDGVTLDVQCENASGGEDPGEKIILEVEPRRLWPTRHLVAYRNGTRDEWRLRAFRDDSWRIDVNEDDAGWTVRYVLPWRCFKGYHIDRRPMRINVVREFRDGTAWCWIPKHPFEGRLHFGPDNPADLGWLFFD